MTTAPAALPFDSFRFSSTTSVDVMLPGKDQYVGLISICGTGVEELIRQCKMAHPERNEYSARFLCLLPSMLMWGGSDVPKVGNDGAYFEDGQKITVELEDPESYEISEHTVTCTLDAGRAAATQMEGMLVDLQAAAARGEMPRVGLDVPHEGGDHDDDDHDDDDEAKQDDEDDEDDDGAGVDAGPPEQLREATLQEHLKSAVKLGTMLGVPVDEIRAAFVAAGGLIVDAPVTAGGGGGQMPGPPDCKQQ